MSETAAGPVRHPVLLDLHGRGVVVVGGGVVATRRTVNLLDAGAVVRVVSPALSDDLAELARSGGIEYVPRGYERGDLDGAWLVHTATGHAATDDAVVADADAARTWCIRTGDPAASSAWSSAVARSGDVTVAVNAGGDPRRAAAIRSAVAMLLDTGDLPIRRRRPGAGSVALVGGGPGDPGLITTRGRRLLAQADVVVVDRLAPRELLAGLDDDVEIIEAGKSPDAHTITQDEINAVLVDRAQAGNRVVRLKGGDPFVLGRGGEEVLACLAAGVEVEVVPGVTSAFAVPSAAGIPVTHRNVSRQVTVVSAHDAALDWPALASLDGTLVLLMGVTRLKEHAARLVELGRAASTPVAVVERGTTPDQRTTIGTLADIGDLAAARAVRSPAVVVVGPVVDLAVSFAGTCRASS
ncbi:MAG: uroporphyrinogen-III C-methyltransferase [Cellulomonas sp.]|uniref:uroporphyrinogen-III C-methyltransferase n=1 Tax=Cellulomonas sp. TaxID=40001 RepID=UPI001824AB44|nr:uroporphyrinogen-III C-methyltransferase [Cellulomonas sp.]NMM29806.1 uroporphyrinogen-III C-methyltransferase [Cellulomonas sp.]